MRKVGKMAHRSQQQPLHLKFRVQGSISGMQGEALPFKESLFTQKAGISVWVSSS